MPSAREGMVFWPIELAPYTERHKKQPMLKRGAAISSLPFPPISFIPFHTYLFHIIT